MSSENADLTATRIMYFEAVTQEIAQIKARSWTFTTVCVGIVIAITNIEVAKITISLKIILTIGQAMASVASFFMTRNSDAKLESRRKILKEIYNRLPELDAMAKYGRQPTSKSDCDHIRNDPRQKDCGDLFFTVLGTYCVPGWSLLAVVFYLYGW